MSFRGIRVQGVHWLKCMGNRSCAGAALADVFVGAKMYEHHCAAFLVMALALAQFVVAALVPLSSNAFFLAGARARLIRLACRAVGLLVAEGLCVPAEVPVSGMQRFIQYSHDCADLMTMPLLHHKPHPFLAHC